MSNAPHQPTPHPPTDPPAAPAIPDLPEGLEVLHTGGIDVVVPAEFHGWGPVEQRGFLADARANAAEAQVAMFAFECVLDAEAAHGDDSVEPGEMPHNVDTYEAAATTVSASTSLSVRKSLHLVDSATYLFTYLPATAALFRAGRIGLFIAQTIVAETSVVDRPLLGRLDQIIAEYLAPTRRRAHAPKVGPLRTAIRARIDRLDPVAAAARVEADRKDQGVEVHSRDNDVASLIADAPAEIVSELIGHIDDMASSAPEEDPRSFGQLQVAALLALCRRWDRLPDPAGHHPEDPDAVSAVRRVSLRLYTATTDLGGERAPTTLMGHGILSDPTAARLLAEAKTQVHRIADLADPSTRAALRRTPSDALTIFCQGRDGTCVFPGCERPAEFTDADHIDPFDEKDPGAGGLTTSDNLACLCRTHHRKKTEGLWVYYRRHDGSYVWIHGPKHPKPDLRTRISTEPNGPLAHLAALQHPEVAERQKTKAEAGLTGGKNLPVHLRRAHRKDRLDAEHRRNRRRGERLIAETHATNERDSLDALPPFMSQKARIAAEAAAGRAVRGRHCAA